MSRPGRAVAATVIGMSVALTACQDAGGSSPAPTRPSTSASIATGAPPTNAAESIDVDPALLEVLPADVNGFPIAEDREEAELAASDAALGRVASAIDAGVAVDASRSNLVSAYVIRLRPGAFTEDGFRQWRDSFDAGACAGGIEGHAQAPIDERTVFVTTCATGIRTYHVRLAEPDLLISATSVGDARFGEVLVANLRP